MNYKLPKHKIVQIIENEVRSIVANTDNADDLMFKLAGLYGKVVEIVTTKN